MPKIPSFKHPRLLNQALTHRSYHNEHPEKGEDNERLEFLGDAVLKFVIAKILYERYPQLREGELSRLRANLENNKHQLAELGNQLELGKLMLLGKGAAKEGGRKNPELLGDTFEAVIGAYFLDSGIEMAREFIEPLFIPLADELVNKSQVTINFKGKFQEWALANLSDIPVYRIIKETGLEHNKNFEAEVIVAGKVYGVGRGKSKKAAEKCAARAALQKVAKID